MCLAIKTNRVTSEFWEIDILIHFSCLGNDLLAVHNEWFSAWGTDGNFYYSQKSGREFAFSDIVILTNPKPCCSDIGEIQLEAPCRDPHSPAASCPGSPVLFGALQAQPCNAVLWSCLSWQRATWHELCRQELVKLLPRGYFPPLLSPIPLSSSKKSKF